jgi:hypothetical protein
MRDTYIIEREIDTARLDLETSLGALRETIEYKLDIKRRVREAIARRVEAARERARVLALQGKELALRGAETALDHKAVLGAVLGGAMLLTLGIVWFRARSR